MKETLISVSPYKIFYRMVNHGQTILPLDYFLVVLPGLQNYRLLVTCHKWYNIEPLLHYFMVLGGIYSLINWLHDDNQVSLPSSCEHRVVPEKNKLECRPVSQIKYLLHQGNISKDMNLAELLCCYSLRFKWKSDT